MNEFGRPNQKSQIVFQTEETNLAELYSPEFKFYQVTVTNGANFTLKEFSLRWNENKEIVLMDNFSRQIIIAKKEIKASSDLFRKKIRTMGELKHVNDTFLVSNENKSSVITESKKLVTLLCQNL